VREVSLGDPPKVLVTFVPVKSGPWKGCTTLKW
jgi:hypothetical protein